MSSASRGLQAAWDAHADAVYRFLARLTRDAGDAEDLLQETFVAYWRKGRLRGDDEVSRLAYLRRTAYRLFLNQRTRAERRRRLAPAPRPDADVAAGPAPARAVADADALDFLMGRVYEALDGLSPRARHAFLLFRFEGLSIAEIAAATDTPPKTVETRVRRATHKLAEQLRAYASYLPE